MLATVVTAVAAFAATNIDDLIVLSLLFARTDEHFHSRQIIAGQYLGFTVLVAVSLAVSAGLLALPDKLVGVLGVIPLALGVRGLRRARRADHGGEQLRPNTAPISTTGVASITIANGADNIAVYSPLFATIGFGGFAATLIAFAVLVTVWCAAGFLIGSHPADHPRRPVGGRLRNRSGADRPRGLHHRQVRTAGGDRRLSSSQTLGGGAAPPKKGPRTRGAPRLDSVSAIAVSGGQCALQLLGLGEVLVRRAVAVVRQRHALARGALARARAALQRVSVDVEPVLRPGCEELVSESQIALDHVQHAHLRVQREVRADITEQRARRPGKVMPVGRKPLNSRLTRAQHALVVGVRIKRCEGSSTISAANSR